MFIDEKLPEVKIEEDGVRVTLSHPYKYPEEVSEVFIPYLKVSHFRKLKSRQLELPDEISILLELTGMSTNELEMMHVQDFSVCLGVVQGFFYNSIRLPSFTTTSPQSLWFGVFQRA